MIAQRSSAWVPIIVEHAIKAGHAGTWDTNEGSQSCIHVRDVAAAVMCILDNALKGKLAGGEDSLCTYCASYLATDTEC